MYKRQLCGHATLACAYVILRFYEEGADRVVFQTLSGELTVERQGELYEMDFPAYELKSVPVTQQMIDAIGAVPCEAYMGRDLLCVFDDERTVKSVNPDQEKVHALDGLLLHVTAKGTSCDCISRTFAPKCGVVEDAVCGSGHCHIVPYWAKKMCIRDRPEREETLQNVSSLSGFAFYSTFAPPPGGVSFF